jgi:hypothetical protein
MKIEFLLNRKITLSCPFSITCSCVAKDIYNLNRHLREKHPEWILTEIFSDDTSKDRVINKDIDEFNDSSPNDLFENEPNHSES